MVQMQYVNQLVTQILLKEFWEKVKRQDWYENTLFVFCADHVGPTSRGDRSSIEWSLKFYCIFHPRKELPSIHEERVLNNLIYAYHS